jgi:Uma2 family endonuclease
LNPTVIVEVLSDSTEKYDRGVKSSHYRRVPSLKELVLISQDRPMVECYRRHEEGGWLLTEASALEQELVLDSVGIAIPLAEIYRNVEFDLPRSAESS